MSVAKFCIVSFRGDSLATLTRLSYDSCATVLRWVRKFMRAFVVFSNGKNGTIGRQNPFKVLPMVPLVMPLVQMVPMLPTG